jgi:hypothetical protein
MLPKTYGAPVAGPSWLQPTSASPRLVMLQDAGAAQTRPTSLSEGQELHGGRPPPSLP